MQIRSSGLFKVNKRNIIWSRFVCLAITSCFMMISIIGCSNDNQASTSNTNSTASTSNTNSTASTSNTNSTASTEVQPITNQEFKDYESLQKGLGIPILVPTTLPEGYKISSIRLVTNLKDGEVATITFKKDEKNEIIYLVQRGGDINYRSPTIEYKREETKVINNYDVLLLGFENKLDHAYWNKDGLYYYSLNGSAFSLTDVETIINNLKEIK